MFAVMKLRPYQTNALQELRKAYAAGFRSLILQAPTGAGKTVIFSSLCASAMQKNPAAKILILTDRIELGKQATRHALTTATIMTVQSAVRRKHPKYDIIIVDEAHKRTFDNFLKRPEHNGAIIIGFTATPMRQGTTKPLKDIYQKIISVTTIAELIAGGWLVPAKTYGAPLDLKSTPTRGGDYDPHALYKLFDAATLYEGVVNKYMQFAANTKAIVFCINVQHAYKTAEAFRARGITAEALDGTTPEKKREQILLKYKFGQISVLCNCDLYTTGFDEPSIETVIINRATKSLPLFLQMAGRGSRIYCSKTHFNLIDMGNNVYTHGFWQQDREFTLQTTRKRAKGVAPVKECKTCGAIIPASATICEYCNALQPVRIKKTQTADFVELLNTNPRDMSFTELEEYAKFKKYKFGWIIRQINQRGDLERFRVYKGYSKGWVYTTRKIYGFAN